MDRLLRLSWMAIIVLFASQSNAAQPQKLFNNQQLQNQSTESTAKRQGRSAQIQQTVINKELLAQTLHQQFQLDDASQLQFKTQSGNAKQSIYQYQLLYKNLIVHNHEIAVIVSPGGDIIQGYGKLASGIASDVEPIQSLDSDTATQLVDAYIADKFSDGPRIFRHREQQDMILIDEDGLAKHVLRASFFTDVTQGTSNPQKVEVFLSIPDGDVLQQNDLLNHVSVGGAGPSGNIKEDRNNYRAEDAELSTPLTFIVNQQGDDDRKDCEFLGQSVETRNAESLMENLPEHPFTYNCTASTYNAYKWVNSAKAPLNDAHYFAQVTVRMFEDYLGQKPFQEENITQYVHYGLGFENAFYDINGSVFYGDGGNRLLPLVELNVVAHEIAHGFTHGWGKNDNQLKRMSSSQANGINEAFSDIAGEVAEYYLYGQTDWLAGVQNFRYSSGWRNLMNPPADGESIDHIDDYNNHDGHFSSGIFNKAFYSLATAQAETVETPWNPKYAFMAFALANENCWLANSEFLEAADCVLRQADSIAEELTEDAVLKEDNSEWTELELKNHIRKAFALVGLNLPVDGLATDFTAEPRFLEVEFTSTSTDDHRLLSEADLADGWSWHWDFGDSQSSTEINPSHIYAAAGEYTVTLTVTKSPEGDTDSFKQRISVSASIDACTVEGLPEGINYLALANFNGVNYESDTQGYIDRKFPPIEIQEGEKLAYVLQTGRNLFEDQTYLQFQIWLDMNMDGGFDPETELVVNKYDDYRVEDSIDFIGAVNQKYDMRVAVLNNIRDSDEPPCDIVAASEFEDYVVVWKEEDDDIALHYELNAQQTEGNTFNFYVDTNDSNVYRLQWQFGDGTTENSYKIYPPSHEYASSGSYNITVKALDQSNQLIKEITKTIQFDSKNIAHFNYTNSNKRARFYNKSWYLKGSTFHWDFGDGNTSDEKSPVHYYEESGSYTVTLTLFNDEIPDGVSYSETIDITITDQSDIMLSHLMKRKINGAYEIKFAASYHGGLTNKDSKQTFTWDFGDGNSETGESAYLHETSHTFEQNGTYTVKLDIEFRASTGPGDDDWKMEKISTEIELTLEDEEDNLYCTVANQTKWNYINSFELNGKTFETGNTGDLINPNEPVIVNSENNTFTIKPTVPYSGYFTDFFQVWIDLDGDYLFGTGDSEIIQPERVFLTLDNDTTESISGTFEIPEEYLLPGTTHSRMRILQSVGIWTVFLPDPCGTYEGRSNGDLDEVEDYDIKWTVLPELDLDHVLTNSTLTIDNQTEYQERLLWHWNFGDGTSSNEESPSHNFDAVGDYTIRLEVSDLDGELLDEWQRSIRVDSITEPQPNDQGDDDDNSGSSGIEILLLLGLVALGRRAKQA